MKQTEYNFWKYSNEEAPLDIIMVGESFCDKDYRISRAESDLHALEFIIDGTGTLEINGQCLTPEANDIFLLTEGSRHCYYADKKKPWHKIFVVFRGRMANELIKCYLPEDTYLFRDCQVSDNFYSILKTAGNLSLPYGQKVELITIELIKIFSHIRNKSTALTKTLSDIIKEKLDYYVDKPFSMDILCSSMCYSKNHIINVFKEKYGISPYVYYNQRRIEAAKYYLRNTQISIKELASILNYTDTNYFSNCFKKATSKTPIQYRKEQGA